MAIKDRLSHMAGRSENPRTTNATSDSEDELKGKGNAEPVRLLRPRIIAMGTIVSLGGLIFGYDTGQISGFVEMQDFIDRFANDPSNSSTPFSNAREGTIVGLLSIGTLIGSLLAGPTADNLGRRLAVVVANIVFCIGVVIQIASENAWIQIALGRLVAGFGVGTLSVLTPMYQAETAPKQIRGALISCYQLFITFGIFLADCINYGTESMPNASSWRIPMGIGFAFPVIMSVGIMFLQESPRWDFRHGRVDRARKTVALSYGVGEDHPEVMREMREIREKFEAETTGDPWYAMFTGPRMAYRTLLGMGLQALQQLTGANFFFYYGTTVFTAVNLSNPFVVAMILGGINFGTTFGGLYVVEHFGRRKSLMCGGTWCFVCFMVFASVGHFLLAAGKDTTTAGYIMIVFAALFIFGYALTWGPIIWALVGEIYPSRYRAKSMGMATSANWTLNFLISFFTPYITSSIDYRYGYIFAASLAVGVFVVYFFVSESQGRTLEEIDTMYVLKITPWKSANWVPSQEEIDRSAMKHDGQGPSGVEHTEL